VRNQTPGRSPERKLVLAAKHSIRRRKDLQDLLEISCTVKSLIIDATVIDTEISLLVKYFRGGKRTEKA